MYNVRFVYDKSSPKPSTIQLQLIQNIFPNDSAQHILTSNIYEKCTLYIHCC